MDMYILICIVSVLLVAFIFLVIHRIFRVSYSYPRSRCQHKAQLQSPEYRCSTKCFDCVEQRSQEFWNASHPAKVFSVM